MKEDLMRYQLALAAFTGMALLAAVLSDSPKDEYEADTTRSFTYRESTEFQVDDLVQHIGDIEVSMGEPTF
ncbi:MAG: hypothetical protein ACI8X5_003903 [Planctomycetota bacterium]